jgi:hypothetical protein
VISFGELEDNLKGRGLGSRPSAKGLGTPKSPRLEYRTKSQRKAQNSLREFYIIDKWLIDIL